MAATGDHPGPRHCRQLRRKAARQAFIAFLIIHAAAATTVVSARDLSRRVLLLRAVDRDSAPADGFAASFRTQLVARSSESLQVFDVSLPTSEKPGEADPVLDYVRTMFRPGRLDLVVPLGGPAVTFAQQHREQLFPSTPMLLAGVDTRFVRPQLLTAQDAVVAIENDPALVVETMLQLLPQTAQVFVVVGASRHERFWRDTAAREFQRFAGRLTFRWSDDLSYSEMLSAAATLPPQSAILYALWLTDRTGERATGEEAMRDLRAVANAPIFGVQSSQLGRGIVGGPLMDLEQLSRTTADVAVRILHGESPASFRGPVQKPGLSIFDFRELERWQIAESRLPARSAVRFREPTAWDRYKWSITGGIMLTALQALFIVALLRSRRRRRHAEAALAHLSRSLLKAQEDERTWVGRVLHDDVCQRMVTLAWLLETAARDLAEGTGGAVRRVGREIAEMAHGVQGLSDRLHSSKLELLGLGPSIDALCRETRQDRSLAVTFRHRGSADALPRDTQLAMFRIVQEALRNAMNHSSAHRVLVVLRQNPKKVELVVIDDGCGFDVDVAMRGGGGLIAMRERLALAGGVLVIRSRRHVGTVVRASLTSEFPSVDLPASRESRDSPFRQSVSE